MVFCCSENENSSFLASALDCYRIRIPPSSSNEEIHSRLRTQFKIRERGTKEEFKHAAEIDAER